MGVPVDEPLRPRLLYVGDVPVEASFHGSMLLYRLLQSYPAERLVVIEGDLFGPQTDRRLPGVRHLALRVGSRRLLHTRCHHWYSSWLSLRAPSRARDVRRLVPPFEPQAVLTVGHGYSWMTAARFARQARLPLHFIVHDDWPRMAPVRLRAWIDQQFGEVYRQAASRLCVSPFMADDFQRRYGAVGQVLYPSRGADTPRYLGPAERLRRSGHPPVVAFAGTINSPGFASLLRSVVEALAPHSGELLLFGPLTADQASAAGLRHPRIQVRGMLTSRDLMDTLRRDADVLFVPMSFDAAERSNMQLSFPSKLTDYTAVGLPMLICGPAYCSAVGWAQNNPGVAEVVTSEDPAALHSAVDRLASSADYRTSLASHAQRTGERDFSAAAADTLFSRALTGNAGRGPRP